jgi:hypothetical protein
MNRTFSRLSAWVAFVGVLNLAAGCAITRYYKTGDIEGQINQLYGGIDGNLGRLESDYASKKAFLDGAKQTGADPTKSPYDALTALFSEMESLREICRRDGATARAEASHLAKAIAGKSRVTSEDPAYGEVGKFENRSEELTNLLNGSFGRYTEKSNQFSRLANEVRVFSVEVAKFGNQLKTAIGDIDRQCALVDAKIADAERTLRAPSVPKREERLTLLTTLKDDVAKIRSVQGELETFQKSFLDLSKGQKSIVVGPHLPHDDLFMSLLGVQNRAMAAVADFNAKVDSFNKL